MKFTCDQERLSRMLAVANHAVAKGTGAPPIATNIRLTTEENRIKLDATNLNIGITAWVEATIQEEGEVAVPAKLFTELINALPPGKFEIVVDDLFTVQVKGQRGPARVRGVDPEQFPPMPGSESDKQPVLLKAALLKEVIREVSIAAAEENSGREIFTNVLVQIEKTQITFAAADGWGKMAFRTLPLPVESALEGDILVPVRSVIELASILPVEGMVEIRLSENNSQIIFSTQFIVLCSRLNAGKYPNYKATLPRERQTRVTVKTSDLREVVNLTSLFARSNDDAGSVTIKTSAGLEPGTLTITAQADDVGGNQTTISVAVDGDDQEDIMFNISNMAKVLGVINAPEVIFEIGMTKAPVGIFRPTGNHTCTHSFSSMGSAQ